MVSKNKDLVSYKEAHLKTPASEKSWSHHNSGGGITK